MIVETASNSIFTIATPVPSSTYGLYDFGTVTITCSLQVELVRLTSEDSCTGQQTTLATQSSEVLWLLLRALSLSLSGRVRRLRRMSRIWE